MTDTPAPAPAVPAEIEQAIQRYQQMAWAEGRGATDPAYTLKAGTVLRTAIAAALAQRERELVVRAIKYVCYGCSINLHIEEVDDLGRRWHPSTPNHLKHVCYSDDVRRALLPTPSAGTTEGGAG